MNTLVVRMHVPLYLCKHFCRKTWRLEFLTQPTKIFSMGEQTMERPYNGLNHEVTKKKGIRINPRSIKRNTFAHDLLRETGKLQTSMLGVISLLFKNKVVC